METTDNSKKKTNESKKNENVPNYVTTKVASKMLGVHVLTLHNWEDSGKIDTIRTPGNHRKYNVEKFLKEREEEKPLKKKSGTGSKTVVMDINTNSTVIDLSSPKSDGKKSDVCYIRVSCVGNKDILKSQKNYLQQKYPNTTIIEDIGSVNNFDKQGLKNIINMINNKTVNNVITATKSNLSKFSVDMLNFLLSQNEGGKVVIENYNESNSMTGDLIDDILQTIKLCTDELTELKNKTKKNEAE
jgi:predicted site-specific integrase-resolvase